MANPEHVKIVRQGAAAIAGWRLQNPDTRLDISGADFTGAKLSDANLERADLRKARLHTADLSRAFLREADLRDAELSQCNLGEAMLLQANFAFADLAGANLRNGFLVGANLSGANLAQSDLREAELNPADLTGADLTEALLCGADLRGAGFVGAQLQHANLESARLGWTLMSDCDLSQAIGLSTVKHQGPSTIGVDTIIASFRGAGNKLTPDLETFFLGAGVPKELLAALPGIVGAVEYYSCFISYGQPDLDFAKRLRDELVAKGVPCWLYDLDATPGKRTWKEISEARRQADSMLVICSVAALIRDGVLKEIEEQIDEDPDKIVPISRDNTWNQPGFAVTRGSRQLKPFVDDRNYADFSDESCYEEALQRLLKALRRKPE